MASLVPGSCKFKRFFCQVSLAIEELIFCKPTKISAYPLILTISSFSDNALNQIKIEPSGIKEYMKNRLLAEYYHLKQRIWQQWSSAVHTTSSELEFYTSTSLASLVVVYSHCSSCTSETALTFLFSFRLSVLCFVWFFKSLKLIWSAFHKIHFRLYYFLI